MNISLKKFVLSLRGGYAKICELEKVLGCDIWEWGVVEEMMDWFNGAMGFEPCGEFREKLGWLVTSCNGDLHIEDIWDEWLTKG